MVKLTRGNPHIDRLFWDGNESSGREYGFCALADAVRPVLEDGLYPGLVHKLYPSAKHFALGQDMFLQARDYFHQHVDHRNDVVPVLDAEGKRVAYLFWQRNHIKNHRHYNGMNGPDYWDYDFRRKPVNEWLLSMASSYVFWQLEEYTHAIATYLLKRYPERRIYFIDKSAKLPIWGENGERVAVVEERHELPHGETCLYVVDALYDHFGHYVPESQNRIYNSINVMFSMLWGSNATHPGSKMPCKTIVKLDNRFGDAGLVDIIKVVCCYAYQSELQGFLPVADITKPNHCQYSEPGINVWNELFQPLNSLTVADANESKNLITASREELQWAVETWQVNPLWREADFRAAEDGYFNDKTHLSDESWSYVLDAAPDPLRPRLLQMAAKEQGKQVDGMLEGGQPLILGVIMRGSDYRKEANARNAINANNADLSTMLSWCHDLIDIHGYDFIYLATEDEEYYDAFAKEFPQDTLLSVAQTRVSFRYEGGRHRTTRRLLSDKGSKGLRLARTYITVLKCLAACDDLISSVDAGTFRQAVRWNEGKYGFCKVVEDHGLKLLPGQRVVAEGKKDCPRSSNETRVKCRLACFDLHRPMAFWGAKEYRTDFRSAEGRTPQPNDFLISDDSSLQGTLVQDMPVLPVSSLCDMQNRPFVLVLKDYGRARDVLMGYGFLEGVDFAGSRE